MKKILLMLFCFCLARVSLAQALTKEEFETSGRFSVDLTSDYSLILHPLQIPYMGWGVGGRVGYDLTEKLYLGAKFIYYFGGKLSSETVVLKFLEYFPYSDFVGERQTRIMGYSYYGTVDFGYYILREKSSLFNNRDAKIKLLVGLGYLHFFTEAQDIQSEESRTLDQHGIAITPGIIGTIKLIEFGKVGIELALDIRYHVGILLPAEPPRAYISVPGDSKVYVADAILSGQDARKINVNQTFSFNAGIGFCF